MERVNKTITFGAGDKELCERLKKKGYFDKTFNFTRYIKDLIIDDLDKSDRVFTEEEENRILELLDQYIKSKYVSVELKEDRENVKEDLTESDLDFIESLVNIKEIK